MSERRRLPQRRPGQRFNFHLKNLTYTATVGYYPDGEIGEVFLTCGKTGSDANLAMLEAAIALSLALQYGATIKQVRTAMPRRDDGSAEGPLGTLLDLLAKEDAKDAKEELLR